MPLKNNYIKLSGKFGGTHALIGKGLTKSVVNSIMRGSDIGVSKAYEVAKVLGVSVEELVGGEAAKIPLVEHNNEEVKYIDKLLSVLRGHDEAKKSTVKGVLDMAKQDAWTQEQRQAYKKTAP